MLQNLIDKYKKYQNIVLILFLAFVSALKIFFMFNFAFRSDIIDFHYNWCKYISQHNIFSIYSSEATVGPLSSFPINYPPIFLFLLWPISGLATSVFDSGNLPLYFFLVKLPIILINTGFSVYLYKKANKAFGIFWYCNPLFLFDSEIWGQTDTLLCIIVILFVLSITKHEYIKSGVFFAAGCLLKLQMCYLFPVFLVLLFKSKSIKKIFESLTIGGAVGVLGWLPFAIYNKDILTPIKLYLGGVTSQTRLSYNAVNIYAPWATTEIKDISLFGLPGNILNFLILLLIVIFSSIVLWKAKTVEKEVAYVCLYLFSIYMLTFSQHERYLIPTTALFALLAFLYNKKHNIPLIASTLSSMLCMFVVFIGDLTLWDQLSWTPPSWLLVLFNIAFLLSIFSYLYAIYIIFIREKLTKDRKEEGAAE